MILFLRPFNAFWLPSAVVATADAKSQASLQREIAEVKSELEEVRCINETLNASSRDSRKQSAHEKNNVEAEVTILKKENEKLQMLVSQRELAAIEEWEEKEQEAISKLLQSNEEMEKITEDLINRNEIREKEVANMDMVLSNLIRALQGDEDLDEELSCPKSH